MNPRRITTIGLAAAAACAGALTLPAAAQAATPAAIQAATPAAAQAATPAAVRAPPPAAARAAPPAAVRGGAEVAALAAAPARRVAGSTADSGPWPIVDASGVQRSSLSIDWSTGYATACYGGATGDVR